MHVSFSNMKLKCDTRALYVSICVCITCVHVNVRVVFVVCVWTIAERNTAAKINHEWMVIDRWEKVKRKIEAETVTSRRRKRRRTKRWRDGWLSKKKEKRKRWSLVLDCSHWSPILTHIHSALHYYQPQTMPRIDGAAAVATRESCERVETAGRGLWVDWPERHSALMSSLPPSALLCPSIYPLTSLACMPSSINTVVMRERVREDILDVSFAQ